MVTYHCNLGERRKRRFDLVDETSVYCTSEDNQVDTWSGPPTQCIIPNKCIHPVIESGHGHEFEQPQELMMDQEEAWYAAVNGVTES